MMTGLMYRSVFAAVLALISAQAHAAELVENGGFETGDFSGWTQVGNSGFSDVVDTGFTPPYEGVFQAFFGPVGGVAGIRQDLATVPGQTYQINFALFGFAGAPSSFAARFGASDLLLLNDLPADLPYTAYSFSQVASGASTPLSFTFRHDPLFWQLDSVSVTDMAVPEPQTWAMMLLGLAAVGGALRSRRRVAQRVSYSA